MATNTPTIDPFTKLVTTQELQHNEVMKEIAGVKEDIKTGNDGTNKLLAEHEVRLAVLETFKQTKVAEEKIEAWNAAQKRVEEVLADARVRDIDDAVGWVQTMRLRWKLIIGMVIGVSTALGILISYVSYLFGLFQ